jgi:hypothetical protein
MSVELLSTLALTYVTGHATYVTQVPPHRRRQHAEYLRSVPSTVWIFCLHNGRWILWQVTTYLPRKRG